MFCTYDEIGSEKILGGTTMVKGRDEIEMHLLWSAGRGDPSSTIVFMPISVAMNFTNGLNLIKLKCIHFDQSVEATHHLVCTYDGIGSEKILGGTTMAKGKDEIEMHLLWSAGRGDIYHQWCWYGYN